MRERRAIFVADGTSAPDHCLCVDGLVQGATATYSHWQGADSPVELAHDLSTGIVLRAAADPEKYLRPYTTVANNHIDTDGLLSMAVACDASLCAHAEVLLSAAAYGDFTQFPSIAGARLALCIQQYIVRAHATGDGWEQRCIDAVIPHMRSIMTESEQADTERDRQITRILDARQAIVDVDGEITIAHHQGFSVISRLYQHGHHPDGPTTVEQDDDVPAWAWWDMVPSHHFQLLCLTSATGTYYQLDTPRHAWAHTCDLPTVDIPDCTALCQRLQAAEKNNTRWLAGAQASALGFVCLLGSAEHTAGELAASSLSVQHITTELTTLFATV